MNREKKANIYGSRIKKKIMRGDFAFLENLFFQKKSHTSKKIKHSPMEQSTIDVYCVKKSRVVIRMKHKTSTAPKKKIPTRLEEYYEVRPIKRNIIKKYRHTPRMRQAKLHEFEGVKKKSKKKIN